MSISDSELMEKIKKVKVTKRVVPDRFDIYVKDRELSHDIFRMGQESMKRFFEAIGEGSFYFAPWYGISEARQAAREAGFILTKNKLNDSYVIYKKERPKPDLHSFNTDLLIPGEEDDEEKEV